MNCKVIYTKIMHKLILHTLLACCTLLSLHSAYASHFLPQHAPVPGGVVIIKLEIENSTPPQVFYANHRTLVLPDPQRYGSWLTVVGIPIDANPGSHQIEIVTLDGFIQQEFDISAKKYPQEKLRISNHRKVAPLAEDMPMIEAQYLETIVTYEHWAPSPVPHLKLSLPVKGRKSSPFGLQRIMNDIPQNPHSGLDIAAIKGTVVTSAQVGKIINIGNFFYSGNIVFVDHGQGLITSYCHLDTVSVKKGQQIAQGESLGTVGNTGRATGPHLHWSVSLNGVRVDPQLFLYE